MQGFRNPKTLVGGNTFHEVELNSGCLAYHVEVCKSIQGGIEKWSCIQCLQESNTCTIDKSWSNQESQTLIPCIPEKKTTTIQRGTAKQPRKEQSNNRESKHCNWRRIWKCSTDLNIQIECENQCKDCHCFVVIAPSYWPGDVWWNLHQILYFR